MVLLKPDSFFLSVVETATIGFFNDDITAI